MFPMTMTIHSAKQLNAVLAALQPDLEASDFKDAAVGAAYVEARDKVAENEAQAKKEAAAQSGKPSGATTARSPRTAEAGPSKPVPSAAAPEKATAKPEAEKSTEKDAAASSAAEPVTYAAVASAITALVKKDRAKVVAVLEQFGAAKGPDLKPEQYAAFLDALEA